MRIRLAYHRYALFVTLYFVVVALLYLHFTPPLEAPDEGAHLLYADSLANGEPLPVLTTYQEMWQGGQLAGHHPPLYYALFSLPLRLTARADRAEYYVVNPFNTVGTVSLNNQNAYLHFLNHSGDTGTAIVIGRLFSIALGVVTLWMVYLSAYTLSDDRVFSALVMLLAAAIPMFVFISAAINNDNLGTTLFSAGILWLVTVLARHRLNLKHAAVIGVILGAVAITKLNTVILFGIVGVVLLAEVLARRLSWRAVVMTLLVAGGISAVIAGWWYLRNWQLYGDPLALAATRRIWSRGLPPTEWNAILSEAKGVWDSFWLIFGSFNIRADNWFYTYVALAFGTGILGAVIRAVRERAFRPYAALMVFIILMLITGLIVTTRQINVSQGRILFPGLAAFAILLVSGWRALLGKRWYGLPIIPLAVMTMVAPFAYLIPAYRMPEAVAALPEDALPVNASADGLELLAYRYTPASTSKQGPVTVDLYIQGTNPENPALFIKLIDPVTQVPVGGVDTYPGMAYTGQFDPNTIYHITETFPINDARVTDYFSRRMNLVFGWRRYDPANPEREDFLGWQDTSGRPLVTLLVPGPAYLQPDYAPPEPQHTITVQFGDTIQLTGYSLSQSESALTVSTNWLALGTPDQDWVVSVGLLNVEGTLVTQADDDPAYFPTSRWQAGLRHHDERTLDLPADLAPGTYRLYIALYSRGSDGRLPVSGAGIPTGEGAFTLPEPVIIP